MSPSIKHHPDAATLMSYAAGSLPEALAAVVACHLSLCPACARDVRRMEAIGAAMFTGLEIARLDKPAPVIALRRIEAEIVGEAGPAAPPQGEVPAPLSHLIGPSLDEIPWRRLGIGVWHHRLKARRGKLRVIKVAGGSRIPDHAHGGSELTLVLRGAYQDQTGSHRRGDLADLDESVEHTPVADTELGCICLVAYDQPIRFKSWLHRALLARST